MRLPSLVSKREGHSPCLFFGSALFLKPCRVQKRWQTSQSSGSARDKRRAQPNADPTTGQQMAVVESPDMTPHLQFSANNLEYVKIPDVSEERRNRTDMEREQEMRKRFGEYGPGSRPEKSIQQIHHQLLQEQQDIDGLPWEVRWKKSLIPTSEEVIQDIRDRFDLFVQDPIEREQEWYLHWKDRAFKIQKDRMIWPQGYTDYLDHYDPNGRRRVLPTDQRWSDSSWKHLADTHYKDRMWLIEGEERKAVHQSLKQERELMAEEEQRQLEIGDVYHGIMGGAIDLDPEQTYQALTGSADPLEVGKTKLKIQSYGALHAIKGNKATDNVEIDPISGLPKSDMEPLPTGITVEQGAALATQSALKHEMMEQTAEAARLAGKDPTLAFTNANLIASVQHGGKPALRTLIEDGIEKTEEKKKAMCLQTSETRLLDNVVPMVAQIEQTVSEENITSSASRKASSSAKELPKSKSNVEGFIHIPSRPSNTEPTVPAELCNAPMGKTLEGTPDWYRETLVETQPLIQSYGMTHDPIEERHLEIQYYHPPPLREEERVTNDRAIAGESAFDEVKLHKLRSLPELVEGFKPLPLFREVTKQGSLTENQEDASAKSGVPTKKSEKLRKERLERMRKAKLQYDPDIILPNLPWETDSITDPYRGVEMEDAVDFNKADLEKTWRAYRETFQQSITEFGNLTQVATEQKCEQMLIDTMRRFQDGEVGDHPTIPAEQEEVFRLVFIAHTKHFLADFYKFKGSRNAESNVTKSEADDILRRTSAKCKLLGKNFMDFIQEMTALELDTVRKNPIQRYAIMVRDRKYEPISRPFMNWIKSELSEFTATEFLSVEQLDTHKEFLLRHCNDARLKCPARLNDVSDSARDAAVEAFFHWCRGALSFYTGKHLMNMYLSYADTRFRSKAEENFEDSIEWFSNYAKGAKDVVHIPIPDSDPPYEYDEKDFLDGENAYFAEISGLLDKAEGLWHSGTRKRWYPVTDETEYMWYNERRGRITLALDISDRCLENVNKKTHPSIHPFPERARPFLEGAPLTQETAEHLWLRYMGDLYYEHSEFQFRMGKFETAHIYREKCLSLYHLAIRTARERLPPSWKAPLLTEAKYLLRSYRPGMDIDTHILEVETVVDKLFYEKEPPHWVEPFTDLPFRLAIVHENLSAFGERITRDVLNILQWKPSNELLAKNMEQRARGGDTLPELKEYFQTVNRVAETVFRERILKWRSREKEGSDPYLFWTHLYFAFRVYPETPEDVQKMWDMYEPAFKYIYTQCALASKPRGYNLINDALRRICQILLAGNKSQKTLLLEQLTTMREKMAHVTERKELDRTIIALEEHLQDPSKMTYVYGINLLQREATRREKILQNPTLAVSSSREDYTKLRERQFWLRQNATTLDPRLSAKENETSATPLDENIAVNQSDKSTKEMFRNV